ncbi:hypothetical protein ACET8K_17480 [Aeromonas veronii]
MDLLADIREKLKGNPSLTLSSGIEAVATHIEVGEKYHYRAKLGKVRISGEILLG